MTDSNTDQPSSPLAEWGLWFQWVLATTLGWMLGQIFFGDIGIGIVVGLLQWWVLRGIIPEQAGWWIWASTIGWLIGWLMFATDILPPPEVGINAGLVGGAAVGVIMGTAQWLFVFRKLFDLSIWWIPISVAGWSVALSGALGWTVTGTVVGAVTGFLIDWFVRHADEEEEI